SRVCIIGNRRPRGLRDRAYHAGSSHPRSFAVRSCSPVTGGDRHISFPQPSVCVTISGSGLDGAREGSVRDRFEELPMKRRMLLLAATGFCLLRAELLWAQVRGPVRLVFDQAHGEQPPPDQLGPLARKLGLEVQTSAEPITGKILEGARMLYLRAPSREFTSAE